ncbi:hypothetical protein AMAG_01789 [Allomyces macrogynus ATCC 38327]|uniref:Protein YOP1 n=1 Tax=Allomyces macrogynus (strain ATCC 38327) TaxID=578462 RepID=A0A0L0S0N8_ALLM3|nr:hypothetical protein AMAG_01789 [Allomyces macrogynus ATCC 38327]|eukprot:KNE55936.1 hypothetical protein AMAG_01789 [Allomyces macrogynus ATCC 38327]
MVLVALATRLLVLTMGFLHPAYKSFKMFRSPVPPDNTLWWVEVIQHYSVMSVFGAVEWVVEAFLFWIPFYYELKFLFIVWLVSPFTRGSVTLYRQFLAPLLFEHEETIDRSLERAQIEVRRKSSEYSVSAYRAVRRSVLVAAGAVLHQNLDEQLQAVTATATADPATPTSSTSSGSGSTAHIHHADADPPAAASAASAAAATAGAAVASIFKSVASSAAAFMPPPPPPPPASPAPVPTAPAGPAGSTRSSTRKQRAATISTAPAPRVTVIDPATSSSSDDDSMGVVSADDMDLLTSTLIDTKSSTRRRRSARQAAAALASAPRVPEHEPLMQGTSTRWWAVPRYLQLRAADTGGFRDQAAAAGPAMKGAEPEGRKVVAASGRRAGGRAAFQVHGPLLDDESDEEDEVYVPSTSSSSEGSDASDRD